MIKQGLIAEVKKLSDKYGWDCECLKAIGYREWQDYFLGQKNLDQTKQLVIKNSLHLAKRQATWFNRNKSIHWFTTPVNWSQVVDLLTTILEA